MNVEDAEMQCDTNILNFKLDVKKAVGNVTYLLCIYY